MGKRTTNWLALVAVLLSVACGKEAHQEQTSPQPVPVRVAVAEQKVLPRFLETVGTVVSPRLVQVRPRVGGMVMAVHFREGELVREGQLLISIDPSPFENAVREMEARLARDRALLAKAKADLTRAQVLAVKDFITAEQLEQAQANVRQLEAAVDGDQAALEQARLQLSYCSVTSPITGRAGQLLIHPGNLVKANNDKAFVTIAQVDPIVVLFTVPEKFLPELRAALAQQGIAVEVRARDDHANLFSGKVYFLDNAVDEHTGTIALKARLANEKELLWPGQFVDVRVYLGEDKSALVIPSSALISSQQGQSVFVVKQDNTVELRPIQVKATVGELISVAEGLTAGETVVTDGQLRLVPGSPVEVHQP